MISYYLLFEQTKRIYYQPQDVKVELDLKDYYIKNFRTLDPRYDVLFAALLNEESRKLPKNINFVSWNYDVQFELSFGSFFNFDIFLAFDTLKVYPSPFGRNEKDIYDAKFLKLNGTAGLSYTQKSDPRNSAYQFFEPNKEASAIEIIEKCTSTLVNILHYNDKDDESMLHFAWEDKPEIRASRSRAKKIIEETDVLIVIGYSFPIYNRSIDKQILSGFKTGKKVYLQVQPNDFVRTAERIKTTNKNISEVINP